MNRNPSANSSRKRPDAAASVWLSRRGMRSATSAADTRKLAASIQALWSRRTEQRELLPAELRRASSPAGSRPGSPTPAPYEHRRARRRRGRAQPVPSRRERRAAHRRTPVPSAATPRFRPSCAAAGSRRRHRRSGRRQRSHSEIEPIDDYAAEESGEDDRQEVEEHDEGGERRAPGRGQDEPRDCDLRRGVAAERDRVRGVERVERRPPHTGVRLGRHYNPPRCERRRLRLRCAAHGSSGLLRRPLCQHEDDRRPRGRGGPLLARDQRGTVDSPVDDLDRHGDVRAPPRLPPLGRDPRPVRRDVVPRLPLRTDTTSRASCSTRTTSSRISRGERARHLGDARRRVRMAAHEARHAVLSVRAQLGDPLPYDRRYRPPNWLAAKTEVIEGIQSDSASALESMRERYRAAWNASRRFSWRRSSRSSRRSASARTRLRLLSDHGESWVSGSWPKRT